MKPSKIYRCETCRDSGYVPSAFGLSEPCPNCPLGTAASWNEPSISAAKTRCASVAPDASPDSRWTPAQVARALKVVLYIGVAVAAWALNYYSGEETTAENKDGLGEPCTTGPAAANDFSSWEPES